MLTLDKAYFSNRADSQLLRCFVFCLGPKWKSSPHSIQYSDHNQINTLPPPPPFANEYPILHCLFEDSILNKCGRNTLFQIVKTFHSAQAHFHGRGWS